MTFEEKYKDNLILPKTFIFAKKIVVFAEQLSIDKKFIISNQLLKSGTSIGANIKESQNSESRDDFIYIVKISMKEAEETEYWLYLCNELETYPN